MTKEGLFWTLRRETGSTGYKLMQVTTERGRRYWGRDFEGDATNARAADCRGRFETVDQARGMIDTIRKIEGSYRAQIEGHRTAIRGLEDKRDAEIDDSIRAAIKGSK
jgi:hypothetical protein